ncbi:uncharacterized protein SETTUDRAFT_39920 [Exserohilum turcica Et28A]|uniref:Uncharacterized protein n=1 Tax=Exserohilum turcicum (strain 28A) TaxID=671987 RepID=R0KCF8_EXST2|nr:uncharacterized protein SETTUDRAFT_39920 [Exserohilum turcica Et28A]EOA85897.1 hypothetical protein SETTUDRAFT_39920 [Exserohilum turcica Et28A]
MCSLLRSKHRKARNELRITHTSLLAEWSTKDEMKCQMALPGSGCECTSLCQPRIEPDHSGMVLRHALDRAMGRYEDERILMLVKYEYEVLYIGQIQSWMDLEDNDYEIVEIN